MADFIKTAKNKQLYSVPKSIAQYMKGCYYNQILKLPLICSIFRPTFNFSPFFLTSCPFCLIACPFVCQILFCFIRVSVLPGQSYFMAGLSFFLPFVILHSVCLFWHILYVLFYMSCFTFLFYIPTLYMCFVRFVRVRFCFF